MKHAFFTKLRSFFSPPRRHVDVSVIIPCHNYAQYLPRAIESILDQTVRPLEILVVDDASTDATKEVALSYQDRGVSYLRTEHRDLSSVRNSGAHATKASFILFLDADDYLQHDYIEKCLEAFKDHRIGFAYGDVQKFGEISVFRRSPDFDPELLSRSNYICSNAMIRREAFDLVSGYRSIPHALEDWDFYRRLVAANYRGKRVETKNFYFIHRDSMLQKHNAGPHCTHFHDAALLFHPLTICTVFTKCSSFFPAYREALIGLDFDPTLIQLCWIDASGDADFNALLRSSISRLPFGSVRFIDGAVRNDRRPPEELNQRIQLRAYNQMIRECTTDYVLTLADDIAAPSNALHALLSVMKENFVAVVAPIRRSSGTGFEVWTLQPTKTIEYAVERGHGNQRVDGAGLGCALLRTARIREVAPLSIGSMNGIPVPFDEAMFLRLRGYGQVYCNWDLEIERMASPHPRS